MDSGRTAWRNDTARPVAWSAWYPATAGVSESKDILGSGEAPLFTAPPVAPAAALNGEKAAWPVVILSHGTGGSAQSLCWLGHALARNGFLAIAVSHHGNTSVEPYLPEGFLCWWERASDFSFILDELSRRGPLAGRLSANEVYGVGFSLGAHTVLSLAGAITHMPLFESWAAGSGRLSSGPREFPQLADELQRLLSDSAQFRESWARQGRDFRNARLQGLVVLAPAPPVRALRPETVAAISMPVKIIAAAGDREAPAEHCAIWLASQNPAFQIEMLTGDVGHYVFLPEATPFGMKVEPALCADAKGVDRRAIHEHVAAASVAAFQTA